MEPKKTQVVKAILRKWNKVGGIMLPDFELYYKSIVIKGTWYGMDKTDRTENPETNL